MKINKINGSLTVEAAVVVPMVVCFLISFIYLINIISFKMELYTQINKTANMISKYAYTYSVKEKDCSEFLDSQGKSTLAVANIYLNLAGKVDSKIVVGGLAGISLINSKIEEENGNIDIVANYYVRIPSVFSNLLVYRQQTRVKARMFIGQKYDKDNTHNDDGGVDNEDDNEEEEYVYISKTSKVYHTNENCTYIKPRVKQINKEQLADVRNESGAKYYACEICCESDIIPSKVYILTYGTRYHVKMDCSEIKRTVRKVKLSSVKEMRQCAKCAME